MSNVYVDGSTATYCASFGRDGTWSSACVEGAAWLQDINRKHLRNKAPFFIHIDSHARPDSRIQRYYGVFKRKKYANWAGPRSLPIFEDKLPRGSDVIYFGATQMEWENMPEAVDFCRVNRNQFLVLSNSEQFVEATTRRMALLRLEGVNIRVDQLATIELLKKAGLTPVRIWESHDDPKIFVEVYSEIE